MKIIFEKVLIKDFLSIGSAEVNLSDQGITLVSGINNQDSLSNSNGSGKSSIFEAILWNLTGLTSRGSSLVSNIVTENPAYVELYFKYDQSSYRVIRKADPSSLLIYKDGEDISGNTFTKSKKILADLLNFTNYDMLSSIIILTQGLGGKLSNLKPSERKSRLELFSNLNTVLESVSDKVSDISNNINLLYTESSNKLSNIEGKISSNNKLINDYSCKVKELLDNTDKILSNEEVLELENSIIKDKEELSDIDNAITTYTIQRGSALSYKLSLENNLSNYRKEVSEIKNNYGLALSRICPLCSQPLHDNIIIDKYDSRLKDLSELILTDIDRLSTIEIPSQEDIDKLVDSKKDLQKSLTDKQSLLLESSKYNSSIDTWKEMISKLEEEISKLEPDLLPTRLEISSLDRDSKISKWYKQVIPRKFRNFLLDNVVEFINKRLEYYSKYLFSTKIVKLINDGNNILIKLGDLNFENLSGGEGRRVDLLIQLALRDLAINQSGFYCNLLVMDEVFDYLDTSGINNLILMLDKESSFSESLMIITHKTDISIPVNNNIIVTKNKEGISSIKYEKM